MSAAKAAKRKREKNKTAKNSAIQNGKPSPVNGNVLPVGNHPGNTGGKPGRSGRPTLAFKAFLAELRNDPDVQEALERTLKDNKSRHYAAALKVLVDYDEELPANNMTPEERLARVEALQRLARERAAAAVAA